MIPTEPRLDVPFLGMTICAFALMVGCFYYRRLARRYKLERDNAQLVNHAIKTEASSPRTTNPPIQLTGKDK